jgi:hypothetical protein
VTAHSNEILSKFKAVSRFDPKIKFVSNFKLYNFAKRSKARFQIDFEL